MIARDHPFAERILSLVPINSLDPRLQDQALAQGELLEFKRKKTVFEAGARDPYTFYLLDGELELQAQGASPMRMQPGDENARRALAQLQPRRYTALALSPVTVFRIERAVLDHILADEQMLEESGGDMEVQELDEEEEDDGGDWMTRLLSSELFIRLPHENIQRFFTELEPLDLEDGALVVEQGTPGDYLYIVAEGRCAVVRRAPGAAQEVQLAVLKEGDTFGEEALLTNSPRNASVRMVGAGMMMRLPKRAFEELLSNPTLKAVPWSEACKLAEAGAVWLDVRFPDEHEAGAIEGSINVPLNVLRLQAGKLDRDKSYIVYCDTGARSSAGAFLMARLGHEATYLAGGLERTPLADSVAGSSPAASPAGEEAAEDTAASGGGFEFEFVTGDSGQAAPEAAPEPEAAAKAPEAEKAAPPAPADRAPAPAATTPEAAAKPAPAAPAGPDMAEVRARLASLKAERDKATAYGKKAADAARELKRRNEEANRVLKEERARREALEKELAALRADTQREEALEVARLKGELDKAARRVDTLAQELAADREKNATERARLEDKLAASDARIAAVIKEKDDAQALHVAAEVTFEESLRGAREASAELGARVESLTADLEQTRTRLAEAEARGSAVAADRAAQASEVEQAVREAEERVREQAAKLEQERARISEELEQLKRTRQEEEARSRAERAELDKELSAQRARAEELDRREMDLSDARASVDQQLAQREQEITERAAALAREAEELSGEKAAWKQTVEQAITEERARLESDYARYREEMEAEAERRAAELAAEQSGELSGEFEAREAELRAEFDTREAELRAEHEARETQMRSQVEAHVAKLLAEFDARLAKVRSGYETRLTEQEAILEDERRRLETEVVRLREALADARQSAAAATPAAPAPAPAPRAEAGVATVADDALALDLELDVPAAAAAVPAPRPRAAPPAVPVLDLELDLDEPAAATAPARPAAAKAAPESEVPVIEMPGEDQEEAVDEEERTLRNVVPSDEDKRRVEDDKRRVVSPQQLAEIRKRMQEKMRAAKAKAG